MQHPLIWQGYEELPSQIIMENNGNTIIIKPLFGVCSAPTISCANFNGKFSMDSMFFRWGISDANGSEHTINNESYPLELQVLFHLSEAHTLFIRLHFI